MPSNAAAPGAGPFAGRNDGGPRLRYDRVAIALHWLIGSALLVQIGFGLLLDELAPRGTPGRAAVINLHKSVGIVLGLLIVLRLAWRLGHAAPPWPATMTRRQAGAVRLGHAALYGCMVTLPLSGYVASNFSRHGVRFFGIALRPWGPDLPAVYAFLNGLHQAAGWLFAVLIAGHVAMALVHGWVLRDGIPARIGLPARRADPHRTRS